MQITIKANADLRFGFSLDIDRKITGIPQNMYASCMNRAIMLIIVTPNIFSELTLWRSSDNEHIRRV